MKLSGFTLIELMVAVAIIAILAAVAIPIYQSNIIETKIATVISTVGDMTENALQFEQVNGYFPTRAQLGYTEDPSPVYNRRGPSYTILPSEISPYLAFIETGPEWCSHAFDTWFYFDLGKMGVPGAADGFDPVHWIWAQCNTFDMTAVNGQIKSYCLYGYYPDAVGSYIISADNWQNFNDIGSGPNTADIDATCF